MKNSTNTETLDIKPETSASCGVSMPGHSHSKKRHYRKSCFNCDVKPGPEEHDHKSHAPRQMSSDALDKCFFIYFNPAQACQHIFADSSHLELVLLPGVTLASDVLLQVHVIFEWLSGGREGNRGQKLNHQTTKHTHGKREGEKGKEEEEREGRGKQSFRF